MSDAEKYLQGWVRKNVEATVPDDTISAKRLAEECLWEAQGAHVGKGKLLKAAGGDLEAFMLTELNQALERERWGSK